MAKRKPPKHKPIRRTKPCESQPCPNQIRVAGHRCMHHHVFWLAEQWRERRRLDPSMRLRERARLAEIHPGLWSPTEDELIRTLAGIERVDEIARRCEEDSGKRRTKQSVQRRACNLGISTARVLWAAGDLGKVFGVDRSTVLHWMDAGQLGSKPWGGSLHVSNQAQVEAFIREYPWLYDLDRMVGQFKRLAEVVHKRDPWWTTVRVFRETGLTPHVLQTLRNDGALTSFRRSGPNGGTVVYRASEVTNVGALLEARQQRWYAIRKANLIPGGPRGPRRRTAGMSAD